MNLLDKMEDEVPKIGICGFKNIGNTCYMNSVLQLLFHSEVFISFLLDSKFNDYITQATLEKLASIKRKKENLSNTDEVSINRSLIQESEKMLIILKLYDIINLNVNKGNAVITPTSLKQNIDLKLRMFRGYSQHDAHEFLLHLLDTIIDETGVESEPVINNIPKTIQNYIDILNLAKDEIKNTNNIEDKKNIIHKINNFKNNNKEIINKFNGLQYMKKVFKQKYNPFIFQLNNFMINYITCSNCNNTTCNYENNTIISIPIEQNVYESLNKYTRQEQLEDYKCEICKSNQIAFKSCKFWRSPMLLFIHLKRFKQFPNGRLVKDNTHVEIPHTLDLSNYYDLTTDVNNKLYNNYKLKGIVNHHGGLNGGHYTADCINITDKKWYHFDDSTVSKYTNDIINTSSAYILMYEINS